MKKLILVLLIAFSVLAGCNNKSHTEDKVAPQNTKTDDLKRIVEKKKLNVVVDYSSTSYFVYKGQPMGFQYELLKALAKDLEVELDIHVSNNLRETFNGVNTSEFDLIAKNLTVTKSRNKVVDFTEPLALTHQVLVQRSANDDEDYHVASSLDLAGKTIYVHQNSAYVQRLKNLSEEIGESITIVEDSVHGVEQLIALVASGEIDYTVCDENVASVNQRYYPWIDISVPVSFDQKISWAVRNNSSKWKEYINNWLKEYKKTSEYHYIYNKYFSSSRVANLVRSEYNSITGGKISEYDELVREISASFGWDWRLVASVIMQESRFNKYAESWVGAMGLMQLMPKTAERFNVTDIVNPRENIRAGLEYLTWLDEVFAPIIEDEHERLKFVLASYNVGIGHVMDARKLAMKYGKKPSVWDDNVEVFILKKTLPEYYNDPVVRWGYCRGKEPYNYVIKVLDRYDHYLNVLPDENNVSLVSLPVLKESLK
ncbi:MAG: transporter substrate-binding domain-containing protein [Prolixibacteraceae bacterium]|nr:transporter substrate-binding domain-containing protein [Prolixibacteraceae bacterium]